MFDLSAFAVFVSVASITPGPNNCMALSFAGARGIKKGMLFCVGVFFGMFVVMLACAVGGSLVLHQLPRAGLYLKVAGAAYMLWLAWSVLRSDNGGGGDSERFRHVVLSGGLLQLINPKIMVYGLTAFSAFILPIYTDHLALLAFAAVLALGGFIGTICWALFGAVLEKTFRAHPKAINAVLAALLLYCAISMLL